MGSKCESTADGEGRYTPTCFWSPHATRQGAYLQWRHALQNTVYRLDLIYSPHDVLSLHLFCSPISSSWSNSVYFTVFTIALSTIWSIFLLLAVIFHPLPQMGTEGSSSLNGFDHGVLNLFEEQISGKNMRQRFKNYLGDANGFRVIKFSFKWMKFLPCLSHTIFFYWWVFVVTAQNTSMNEVFSWWRNPWHFSLNSFAWGRIFTSRLDKSRF